MPISVLPLNHRGCSHTDIAGILSSNFIRFFSRTLPE
jgi:hypothetical protein